jgi:hypothetical protein
MLAAAVLLSAAALVTGCEEPAIPRAPYPPDRIISGLTRPEVKGLYEVLRDFRHNGERIKEITPNGHLVRVRMSVPSCPAGAGHPYDRTWMCEASVTGIFQLRNKFHRDTGVNGGNVEIEFNAAGDRIKLTETVRYLWDADNRTLRVGISYPGSSRLNFTRNWGAYNMKGTSTSKITTESANESVGFNLSSGPALLFSGSVEKTQAVRTSFFRVLLDGNPYWANEGLFEFTRDPFGVTTFGVGMDWFTDALVHYTETVTLHSAECNGMHKHSGSFDLKYLNQNVANATVKTAMQLGSSSQVSCRAWGDSMAAQLYFRASNANGCTDPQHCGPDAVGERFRSYVRIRDLHNGSCKRQYDAAFTAAVNWNLQLQTSGGQVVTGFDLGSSTSVWDQPSSPSFETVWACS